MGRLAMSFTAPAANVGGSYYSSRRNSISHRPPFSGERWHEDSAIQSRRVLARASGRRPAGGDGTAAGLV